MRACLRKLTTAHAGRPKTGGGAPTLPLSRTGPHDTHQLYKRFRHPNLIECIDSAVEAATIGPNAKEVYMLLPYYSVRGRAPTPPPPKALATALPAW